MTTATEYAESLCEQFDLDINEIEQIIVRMWLEDGEWQIRTDFAQRLSNISKTEEKEATWAD